MAWNCWGHLAAAGALAAAVAIAFGLSWFVVMDELGAAVWRLAALVRERFLAKRTLDEGANGAWPARK